MLRDIASRSLGAQQLGSQWKPLKIVADIRGFPQEQNCPSEVILPRYFAQMP